MKDVKVIRKTTESTMTVTLNFDGVSPEYRSKINTGIIFLNHMIEQLVWRSEVNIIADVELDRFNLSHVICEDLGMTLGKAVAKAVEDNGVDGIRGFGDGIGIIDEAFCQSAISFEGRAYLDFDAGMCTIPESTEGMLSEDLMTFIDGFVQGARCTLHVNLSKGENGHHIWEAVFRSIGIALKNTLEIVESRKNMTSGVAGRIEYIYE